MPDREKVIKGLECCTSLDSVDSTCMVCPYNYDGEGGESFCLRGKLMPDAIDLLKEQKAVKPLAKEDDSYECICGAIVGWDELDASGIVQTHFNYCPFCGKPIDWEGR